MGGPRGLKQNNNIAKVVWRYNLSLYESIIVHEKTRYRESDFDFYDTTILIL